MPRKPATTPRKLPQQDRSRVTVEAILEATTRILVEEGYSSVVAAHAINPRLHQVLSEEIPRSGRSPQMHKADERITELLRTYLDRWRDLIHPHNIDLTVFILSRTVESLCHSTVIEYPNFVSTSQFESEVSNLLLSYLTKSPVTPKH